MTIWELQRKINNDFSSPYEETCRKKHEEIMWELKDRIRRTGLPQKSICMSCGAEFNGENYEYPRDYDPSIKIIQSAIKGDFGKECQKVVKRKVKKIILDKIKKC